MSLHYQYEEKCLFRAKWTFERVDGPNCCWDWAKEATNKSRNAKLSPSKAGPCVNRPVLIIVCLSIHKNNESHWIECGQHSPPSPHFQADPSPTKYKLLLYSLIGNHYFCCCWNLEQGQSSDYFPSSSGLDSYPQGLAQNPYQLESGQANVHVTRPRRPNSILARQVKSEQMRADKRRKRGWNIFSSSIRLRKRHQLRGANGIKDKR